MSKFRCVIVGQGLAGTCLAWALKEQGAEVLVVDRKEVGGSSRVAAGLVNPVTGKGINPSWRVGEFLPVAREFYGSLETSLSAPFWYEVEVARLFAGEKERMKFEKKRQELEEWLASDEIEVPKSVKAEHGGVSWRGGGWLDTREFLDRSREVLPLWYGEWTDFELGELRDDDVVIFCQGAEALMELQGAQQSAMKNLPKRLAKGEILTVRIPGLDLEKVIVRHGWIIPLGEDHLYRVGATYEWDQLDGQPTLEGKLRISEIIGEFTDLPFEVVEHVAGIRPIMRQSRPVIGEIDGGYWFFNGLGSKGTLYAPKVAQDFAESLLKGTELDREYRL